MSISSLLVPAILFFALGMFACIIKSDLKFPPDMHKMLVIYLLIGIGLHGGKESPLRYGDALPAVWAALAFGIGLPIIAYIILRGLGKIDPLNAAAISAHYGSVMRGHFHDGGGVPRRHRLTYEAYPVIMLAIMESPAIMIGLVLAGYSRKIMGGAKKAKRACSASGKEAFTNGSILLLFCRWGSAVVRSQLQKIEPFFEAFSWARCAYSLRHGDGSREEDIGIQGGWTFPGGFWRSDAIIGAFFGMLSAITISVLGGRSHAGYGACSQLFLYRGAPGDATCDTRGQPSFYLTLSLGVTFPFNMAVGVPTYYAAAQYLAGM